MFYFYTLKKQCVSFSSEMPNSPNTTIGQESGTENRECQSNDNGLEENTSLFMEENTSLFITSVTCSTSLSNIHKAIPTISGTTLNNTQSQFFSHSELMPF